MPPEDLPTQGHAAASDSALVVHGNHSAPVAPAVTDRGKERKRRKHKGAADHHGAATAARSSSEIDGAATDDGARRHHHHHRRHRAPAPERTEPGSSKYDSTSSVRHERGLGGGVRHESVPAVTARPNGVVTGGKHRHRDAGSYLTGGGDFCYANGDHAALAAPSSSSRHLREPPDASPRPHRPAKPHGAHSAASAYSAAADSVPARASNSVSRHEFASVTARPNGIVIGGRHRHQASGSSSGRGNNAYADNDAAAFSSSSRLIREPAAAPHHHIPKPPKANGAPSSSASASAAPPGEPDDDAHFRRGLQVAMEMYAAGTLQSAVDSFVHQRPKPAADAVETESLPFYLLTKVEANADLAAAHEKLEAERRAAASCNGKRRRH